MKMINNCLPLTAESIDEKIFNVLRDIVTKVHSRKQLINTLEEFLTSGKSKYGQAYQIPIMIIRGEWGEGKTASYYTYVKPLAKTKNIYSLRASLVTIISDILGKTIRKIDYRLPDGKLNYPLLNIYLALCASNELKCRDGDKAYEAVKNFILDKVKEGYSGLLIFIDEFEELLRPERIEEKIELMEKIEENIRNVLGYYPLRHFLRDPGNELMKYLLIDLKKALGIDELGIFIIYAMTPYAYMTFREALSDEETWGKIARTLKLVDLRSLTRFETFEIVDLLTKYYLGKSVFTVFKDPRLIMTLHILSLGNFSTLNQLLCRLYTNTSKHEIDYEDLIEAFLGYKIYTYIGEREAIARNEYEKIIREVKDYSIYFKQLISKIIISRALNDSFDAIKISALSKKFVNLYGYQLVVKTFLFKLNREEQNRVWNILTNSIMDYMTLSGTHEDPNALRENIRAGIENLFIKLDNTSSEYLLFIPYEQYTFNSLVSSYTRIDLEIDQIKELINKIIENVKAPIDEYGLMLSGYALQTLYPPPLPVLFGACRDPRKCIDIWSDTRKLVTKMPDIIYEKTLKALKNVIKNIEFAEIDIGNFQKRGANLEINTFLYEALSKQLSGLKVKEPIKIGILFVLNLRDDTSYYKLLDYIKKIKEQFHCILVLCIECEEKYITKLNSENLVSAINIDKRTLQDLLALNQAYSIENLIPKDAFRRYCITFNAKTDLLEKIKKLRDDLIKEGLVINDLKNIAGYSWGDLHRYIDLLILGVSKIEKTDHEIKYYIDESNSWNIFRRIAWIKDYTSRARGLIGLDIETRNQFEKIVKIIEEILARNELYEYIGGSKAIVPLRNKICRRIYNLLQKYSPEGLISIDELNKLFIDRTESQRKSEVIDFYLYILERLGLIKRTKNTIKLYIDLDVSKISERLDDLNIKYKKLYEDAKQLAILLNEFFDIRDINDELIINDILSILTCKVHGCKTIYLSEVIENTTKIYYDLLNRGLSIRLVHDILDSISYTLNNYIDEIRKGINDSINIITTCENLEKELIKKREKLIDMLRNLSIELNADFKVHTIYFKIEYNYFSAKALISKEIRNKLEILKELSTPRRDDTINPKKIKGYEDGKCIEYKTNTIHPISCYLAHYRNELESKIQLAINRYTAVIEKVEKILNGIRKLNEEGYPVELVKSQLIIHNLISIMKSTHVSLDNLENIINTLLDNLDQIRQDIEAIKESIKTYSNDLREFINKTNIIETRIKHHINLLEELEEILKKNIRLMEKDSLQETDLYTKSLKLYNHAIEKKQFLTKYARKLRDYNEQADEYLRTLSDPTLGFEEKNDKIEEIKSCLPRFKDSVKDIQNKYEQTYKETMKLLENLKGSIIEKLKASYDLISRTKHILYKVAGTEAIEVILDELNDAIIELESNPRKLINYVEIIMKSNKVIDHLFEHIKSIVGRTITDDKKCKAISEHILKTIKLYEKPVISFRKMRKEWNLDIEEYVSLIKNLYDEGLLSDIKVEL